MHPGRAAHGLERYSMEVFLNSWPLPPCINVVSAGVPAQGESVENCIGGASCSKGRDLEADGTRKNSASYYKEYVADKCFVLPGSRLNYYHLALRASCSSRTAPSFLCASSQYMQMPATSSCLMGHKLHALASLPYSTLRAMRRLSWSCGMYLNFPG